MGEDIKTGCLSATFAGDIQLLVHIPLMMIDTSPQIVHQRLHNQCCQVSLKRCCHNLWGCNLQPLTDWSPLLTVLTDELILTVQPGVQGSV
jgi:hypothetical protein